MKEYIKRKLKDWEQLKADYPEEESYSLLVSELKDCLNHKTAKTRFEDQGYGVRKKEEDFIAENDKYQITIKKGEQILIKDKDRNNSIRLSCEECYCIEEAILEYKRFNK